MYLYEIDAFKYTLKIQVKMTINHVHIIFHSIAVAHPQWVGVRHATESLKIPLILGSDLSFSPWQQVFIEAAREYEVEVVIIGGIPDGTGMFCEYLRREMPLVSIIAIYHGSPSQHFYYPEAHAFNEIVEATRDGYVNKIGVLKHGLAETLSRLTDTPVFLMSNFMSSQERTIIVGPKRNLIDSQLHIGVFGDSNAFKNVIAQILAACLIGKHVTVHARLREASRPDYFKLCRGKIVWHTDLSHHLFVSLTSQMDLMLYVSFTECQPMVAIESMAVGVPVLISDTTTLFDPVNDPLLAENMICPLQDNPDAIRNCILKLLAVDKTVLLTAMNKYVGEFNNKAESLFLNLFNGKKPNRLKELAPTSAQASLDCSKFPSMRTVDTTINIVSPPKPIKGTTVVFCAISVNDKELGGDFISHNTLLLLKSGINVVIFYVFIEEEEIISWHRGITSMLVDGDGKITTVSLLTVIAEDQVYSGLLHKMGALTSFLRKKPEKYVLSPKDALSMSRLWERGLKLLYEDSPFHIVEFVDFYGPAAEVSRHNFM
jgi:hypothetical protein